MVMSASHIQLNTKGPTGNIIHHLNCVHQHTKIEDLPLNQPQQKQMKLDSYAEQFQQVRQQQSALEPDQQSHIENLLYEWIIDDAQPMILFKSTAFCQFVNALKFQI